MNVNYYKIIHSIMLYIDNTAKISLPMGADGKPVEATMALLTAVDAKLKKFGFEFTINVDSTGAYLDVQKKKRTRVVRKSKGLLGA